MVRTVPLALLLLTFLGCLEAQGPNTGCNPTDDPLTQISVREARLEELSLWHAVALFGAVRGQAKLVVIDNSGTTHEFAATLDGIDEGLAMDASAVVTFDNPVQLELPSTGGINVRSLLGVYDGPVAGLQVVAGFKWRHLENPSNVAMTLAHLSLGLGAIPMAFEQIDVELEDDPAADLPENTE